MPNDGALSDRTPLTLEGPVPGRPANALPPVLQEEYGYVEEEHLVAGEATAYAPVGALAADGHWTARPATTAPFRTRILVRRPADPAAFNGTVVVEWLNVTSGVDADPCFGLLHPALLGTGCGYVAVSAQQIAIGGGESILDLPEEMAVARRPLTERSPERYGSLSHPGDEHSYDLFAQVAALARGGELFAGRAVERVIAIGESQSAFRLVTFINAVQPVTSAFDGFLVHSRGAGGAPLGAEQPDPRSSPPVAVRTDLDVPVLQFETETDLVFLRYLEARQPDTDRLVTWEVAGTAHADATILEYGKLANPHVALSVGDLYPSVNRGPQAQVLRAAFAALVGWVRTGTPPPSGDPIEVDGGRLRRDADGIVLGGIRTPAVDVPIATHSGEAPPDDPDNILAQLFGETRPFTPEDLAARYESHDAYVAAVTASADAALAARFLLPEDRDAFVAAAEAAPVPR